MDGRLPWTGSFRKLFDSTALGSTVVTVFDMGVFTSKFTTKYSSTHELAFKSVLETLSATVNLAASGTLVAAPIPNIAPEDTWSERLSKQLDVEQRFPYITLSLYLDNNDGQGWMQPVANIPLHNFGGYYFQPLLYPALTQGTVRLLEPTEKLGASISPALNAGDSILIKGGWSCLVGLLAL